MFHVELAPLGGIFGPLKSDLGVFWPFRGTDFIMGKNKNANFSKSPHGPIFKFCVVIREAILQKMAPILDPVNFFSVLTRLDDCETYNISGMRSARKYSRAPKNLLSFCFLRKSSRLTHHQTSQQYGHTL